MIIREDCALSGALAFYLCGAVSFSNGDVQLTAYIRRNAVSRLVPLALLVWNDAHHVEWKYRHHPLGHPGLQVSHPSSLEAC